MLVIGIGMAPDRWYRVRVGRVRKWRKDRENHRVDANTFIGSEYGERVGVITPAQ
jgi:hypothetical protein